MTQSLFLIEDETGEEVKNGFSDYDFRVFQSRGEAEEFAEEGEVVVEFRRVVVATKVPRSKCQCPVEDYRDYPEGDTCLVCGGSVKH